MNQLAFFCPPKIAHPDPKGYIAVNQQIMNKS